MDRAEALKAFRDRINYYESDKRLRAAAEVLIPELAESEDERIRQEIITALKFANEGGVYDKHITYLEKQKEQKPWRVGANAYFTPEQKPVEGKEYTSPDCGTSACCDDERFEIIAQAKRDIIEKTNIAENELSMELPLLDGILMRVWQVGWLNKKSSWSEEDEKMKERLITRLNWITYNTRTDGTSPNITFFDEIEWLKSLRPQNPLDLPAGFYFIDKNGKKYYTDTLKCGNLKFIANQKEQKPEVEICPHSIKSKSYKEITGDETR